MEFGHHKLGCTNCILSKEIFVYPAAHFGSADSGSAFNKFLDVLYWCRIGLLGIPILKGFPFCIPILEHCKTELQIQLLQIVYVEFIRLLKRSYITNQTDSIVGTLIFLTVCILCAEQGICTCQATSLIKRQSPWTRCEDEPTTTTTRRAIWRILMSANFEDYQHYRKACWIQLTQLERTEYSKKAAMKTNRQKGKKWLWK